MAGDFTRYDDHAVKQIDRNIELIRYRRFGGDLLMLDLVGTTSTKSSAVEVKSAGGGTVQYKYKTISTLMEELDAPLADRFEALRSFLTALGDDVQETVLRFYIAFKRIKNFACVELRPQAGRILVFVKIDPSTVALEPGFTRDVSKLGHYGTGDLEITLSSPTDLDRAKPFIEQSYNAS